MNITVVTVLCGDCEDKLRPLSRGLVGEAFLDQPRLDLYSGQDMGGWQVRRDNRPDGWSASRFVRDVKMMPERWITYVAEGDIIVWADASFEITSVDTLIAPLLQGADLVTLKHPFHATVQDEIEALRKQGYPLDAMLSQVKHMPQNPGNLAPLSIGGLMARRVTRATIEFRNRWAIYYQYGIDRDQLTLTHAIHNTPALKHVQLPWDYSKTRNKGWRFHKA